jgi:ATP-dependent Lon protease
VAEHEPQRTGDDSNQTQPRPSRTALPRELHLLPLLNMVIYPLTVTPLAIGQETSVRLVDEAIAEGRLLGMVALSGARRPERLAEQDFFHTGTAAVVHRMVRLHDNTLRVAVEGIERFRVVEVLQAEPTVVARVAPLADESPDRGARAEARALIAAAEQLARRLPAHGAALLAELGAEQDPRRLSYLAAARLLPRSDLAERQQVLELPSASQRLARIRRLLERDLAALEGG